MLSCVPPCSQASSASLTASDTTQVIGTVSRITRQAATLSLLTVDGRPCRPDFTGIIRSQDVRQTAKDSVKVRAEALGAFGMPRLTEVATLHADLVLLPAWGRCARQSREYPAI